MTRPDVTVGQRYGRGVVIALGERVNDRAGARLLCDCGREYVARLHMLRRAAKYGEGKRSCGCLARDALAVSREKAHAAARVHGLSGHPLYGTWTAMLQRCGNPGHHAYARYGGRGIKVCDRWHDLALFVADIERLIGPRPDGMTLDRVDNDRGYDPGNVRWATRAQQIRNASQARLTEEIVDDCRVRYAWGEATARELAAEYGVAMRTMYGALSGATWK